MIARERFNENKRDYQYLSNDSGVNTTFFNSNNFHRKFYRLKRLDTRDDKTKYVIRTIRIIKSMCFALELPKHVKDEAILLFKQIPSKFRKVRTIEAMAACVLYYQCRRSGYPIFFSELQAFTSKPLEKLQKMFREMIQALNLEYPIPLILPNYLSRFLGELNRLDLLLDLRLSLDKLPTLQGKNPFGILAALLYLRTGETQDTIANLTGVTVLTIRARVKDLQF